MSISYEVQHTLTPTGSTSPVKTEVVSHTSFRGLASLGVVIFHINSEQQHYSVSGLISHGYLYVDLFFALSGFIIFKSYASLFETNPARALPSFLMLRLARIYPLYLLGFLAFFLVGTPHSPIGLFSPYEMSAIQVAFAQHLLMVQSLVKAPLLWNTNLWSLGVEMILYIVFPAIAFLWFRLRTPTVIFGTTSAILIFAALCWDRDMDRWMMAASVARGLASFTLGCFCAGYAGRMSSLSDRGVTLFQWVALLAVLAAIHMEWDFAAMLSFPALLVAFCQNRGGLHASLNLQPVQYLGRISFSLYVTHAITISLVNTLLRGLGNPIDQTAVTGALSYGLLAISLALIVGASCYHLFEIPVHRFARAQFKPAQKLPASQ